MLHVLLLVIALCLGIIALRPYVHPEQTALAFTGRFDHADIVSPMFLYKGNQGVLLWGKRNGNIWFVGRGDDLGLTFIDPVFIARLPLEKLDEAPQ
jgi:hypothetical protein